MAIKFEKKEKPVAKVTTTHKESGAVVSEKEHEEEVSGSPGEGQVEEVEAPWCRVGVNTSYTHNLGDFKSVKIGISLEIPCKPPEINEVYEFVKGWVDERMQKEVTDLNSD